MNNKEILKNVLVTVGLLTTSIVALVYFNSKLDENTSQHTIAIAPSATIHQYNPQSSNYAVANSGIDEADMTGATSTVAPNTPAAVKAANYPNNLVIHASSTSNATVVNSNNAGASIAPHSNVVQQRQQMQMGALTAVSSRKVTSDNPTQAKQAATSDPFQETTEVPGSISRKDLPEDPEEPFPDEETPLGGGMLILGVCALGYTLKQKLSKAN